MIKKLVQEFMAIGYSREKRMSGLEDIIISEYTIGRLTESGLLVIWLVSGNKLKIPWEYIDIFSSLNTVSGEQILYRGLSEDPAEKIIYWFVLLINQLNWGKGKKFLDTLSNICELGTKDLREWFEKEFGEKLRPLEMVTIDSTLII